MEGLRKEGGSVEVKNKGSKREKESKEGRIKGGTNEGRRIERREK